MRVQLINGVIKERVMLDGQLLARSGNLRFYIRHRKAATRERQHMGQSRTSFCQINSR